MFSLTIVLQILNFFGITVTYGWVLQGLSRCDILRLFQRLYLFEREANYVHYCWHILKKCEMFFHGFIHLTVFNTFLEFVCEFIHVVYHLGVDVWCIVTVFEVIVDVFVYYAHFIVFSRLTTINDIKNSLEDFSWVCFIWNLRKNVK